MFDTFLKVHPENWHKYCTNCGCPMQTGERVIIHYPYSGDFDPQTGIAIEKYRRSMECSRSQAGWCDWWYTSRKVYTRELRSQAKCQ